MWRVEPGMAVNSWQAVKAVELRAPVKNEKFPGGAVPAFRQRFRHFHGRPLHVRGRVAARRGVISTTSAMC